MTGSKPGRPAPPLPGFALLLTTALFCSQLTGPATLHAAPPEALRGDDRPGGPLVWQPADHPLSWPGDAKAGTLLPGTQLEFLHVDPQHSSWSQIATPAAARRFAPAEGQGKSAAPVFGYVHADYWLRFAVYNATDRDQELLLELDSLYESVELRVFLAASELTAAPGDDPIRFIERPDQLGRAGRLIAEPVRYLAHRNPVFGFRLPARASAYLVLRTEKATVRRYLPRVYTPAAFVAAERRYQLAVGLFYGALAAVLLSTVFVFALTRRRLYLAYIAWLLAMAAAQLTMDRTAQEWIESVWSGYREWQHLGRMIATVALAVSGGVISIGLLASRGRPGSATRPLYLLWLLLFAACGLYLLALPWLSILRGAYLTLYIIGAFIAVSVLSGVARIYQGDRLAWLYLAAWAGFLGAMAFTIYALNRPVGGTPYAVMVYALKFGAVLEIVFFSLAIGFRVRALATAEAQARAELQSERQRIARDLHDSLGHELSDLYLYLHRDAPGEPGNQAAGRVRTLFERLRDRVHLLRHSEAPATLLFDELTRALNRVPQLGVQLDYEVAELRELWSMLSTDTNRQLHTVRIVQEWLSNTLRYAKPRRSEICWRPGARCLHVIDDGAGFAWQDRSPGTTRGLGGIAERAEEARLRIRSFRREPDSGSHCVLLYR